MHTLILHTYIHNLLDAPRKALIYNRKANLQWFYSAPQWFTISVPTKGSILT